MPNLGVRRRAVEQIAKIRDARRRSLDRSVSPAPSNSADVRCLNRSQSNAGPGSDLLLCT